MTRNVMILALCLTACACEDSEDGFHLPLPDNAAFTDPNGNPVDVPTSVDMLTVDEQAPLPPPPPGYFNQRCTFRLVALVDDATVGHWSTLDIGEEAAYVWTPVRDDWWFVGTVDTEWDNLEDIFDVTDVRGTWEISEFYHTAYDHTGRAYPYSRLIPCVPPAQ